ncbi:hypothetical protein [Streptomyces filamentosus]|uniref:hypothetical protein n=1 Tax=Streptomyces filamentosus TaxID=67294 RepID=UPI0014780703|nr:hypothetical protein [Streptomyces filamentosus]
MVRGGSDYAAEYTSQTGHVCRPDDKEPVTPPGEMAKPFAEQGRPKNGGRADMQCLSKAFAREGTAGGRGGNMTTAHVSDTEKGDRGSPAAPRKGCRRVLDALEVIC